MYGVQRLANGNSLVRAPTGDPVGPRVAIAAVVSSAPSTATDVAVERTGNCTNWYTCIS
jgi:hypothetical protein